MAFRPQLVDLLDPRGFARQKSYSDLLEADSILRARELDSDYSERSADDRLAGLKAGNTAQGLQNQYNEQTLPGRVSQAQDQAAASTRSRNFYEGLPAYEAQQAAFGPQPEAQAMNGVPPYLQAATEAAPSRDEMMYEGMRAGVFPLSGYAQETRPQEPKPPKDPTFKTGEDQYEWAWNSQTKQWDRTNLRVPKAEAKPDVRSSIAQDRRREQLGEKSVTFAAMVKAFNDLDKATGGIYSDTPMPGLSNKVLGKGWSAFNRFVESPEGAAIRIPLYTLINKVLKRESGAAVSEQEFERIKNQLGVSLLDSEQAFRLGVRMMLEQERDAQKQLEAGFGQQAVESLKAEGGLTSGDLPQKKSGPVKVADKAAYDALPSGAEYIGPSGKRARKP